MSDVKLQLTAAAFGIRGLMAGDRVELPLVTTDYRQALSHSGRTARA